MLIDYTLHRPISVRACFEVHGFTVLLGRSGAGKTSLLRALAGLLPAVGTPWNGLPPERRCVGYLPQEALLFPHLSVLDNTAYALRSPTKREQARSLLAALGLAALEDLKPAQLSGGQAKRVALARALARGVELLLLDEPSAGLDGVTRDEMLDWLLATCAARKIPALAATHDYQIAARADHVVLLADGQIIQSGPARAVFAAPASRAAASLLGYDNIYEHRGADWAVHSSGLTLTPDGDIFTVMAVREAGDGLRLTCGPAPCLTITLPQGQKSAYPVGAQVRLDLRAAVRLG